MKDNFKYMLSNWLKWDKKSLKFFFLWVPALVLQPLVTAYIPKAMIDAIDRESKLSDELFLEIVQVEDYLEKTELIEAVRAKCRETGRVQEFNNLLKAWQHKYSQLCNCLLYTSPSPRD